MLQGEKRTTSARRPSGGGGRRRIGSAWAGTALLAVVLTACGTGADELALTPTGTIMSVFTSVDQEGASASLDGATVSGTVHLVAEIDRPASRVSFHLDGANAAIAIDDEAPYEMWLDTSTLSPGEHVLTAEAPLPHGRRSKVEARATFVVAADEPAAPPLDSDEGGSEDDGGVDDGGTDGDGTDGDGTDGGDDGNDGGDDGTDVGTEPEPDPVDPGDGGNGTDDGSSDDTDGGDEPAQLVFDGPIVITSGGTYSGNWESLDSAIPAVTVATSAPVTIENANIRSAGHLIVAAWTDADLTIRNVSGYALYPTRTGSAPGRFLKAEGYDGIRVENSYMEGTSGIYLNDSETGATVKILRNRALNIDGRKSDGQGGWSGRELVQFLQFNKGNALSGAEVAWNEVINRPYESATEDVISTYKTSGRTGDPVRIHDNYIQGAYPVDPRNDGHSGGGIMLGDAGGQYLHAYDNVVVGTGNYGIAIAGGSHNRMYDNTVLSCGLLADGSGVSSSNVGMYIWNFYGEAGFGDNVGSDNRVGWLQADGSRNDWWTPDASAWTGNERLADADCDAERSERSAWLQRTDDAQASIGTY